VAHKVARGGGFQLFFISAVNMQQKLENKKGEIRVIIIIIIIPFPLLLFVANITSCSGKMDTGYLFKNLQQKNCISTTQTDFCEICDLYLNEKLWGNFNFGCCQLSILKYAGL